MLNNGEMEMEWHGWDEVSDDGLVFDGMPRLCRVGRTVEDADADEDAKDGTGAELR